MSGQHLDTCEQAIVGDDWECRHSVSATEADTHELDAGEYHEACCPMCCDGQVLP